MTRSSCNAVKLKIKNFIIIWFLINIVSNIGVDTILSEKSLKTYIIKHVDFHLKYRCDIESNIVQIQH